MALPVSRVPVRIARGTKTDLDTALAAGDLFEGELCYATDENSLYIVESSAFVLIGNTTDPVFSDVAQGGTGSQIVTNMVAITDAAYAALSPPDANTLYMVYTP